MKIQNSNVFQYLERLQRKCSGRMGIDPTKHTTIDNEITQKIKNELLDKVKNRSDWEKTLNRMNISLENMEFPTKYESPYHFFILKSMQDKIEIALLSIQKEGKPIEIPHVVIGTIQYGTINAMMISQQSFEEKLIVFDRSFFPFASLLAKMVALHIPFEGKQNGKLRFSCDPEKINENLRKNDDANKRFAQLFASLVLTRDIKGVPRHIIEAKLFPLVPIFRDNIELFALCHEYGHIITNPDESKTIVHKILDCEVNEINYSWENEYEADEMGFLLLSLINYKEQGDIALSYASVMLFFCYIEMVESGYSIINPGKKADNSHRSHPSLSARRDRLEKFLNSNYDAETSKRAIRLAGIIQQILRSYYDLIKPHFLKFYEKTKQNEAE